MTDAELLKRARVFDAGPPPVVNGYVLDEDDDAEGSSLTVEYRGESGWAICLGSRVCIDKVTGGTVFESMPSHRGEDFIARTRFPSVAEAFAFLEGWKPCIRAKALQSPHMIRWKDQLAIWAKVREAKS